MKKRAGIILSVAATAGAVACTPPAELPRAFLSLGGIIAMVLGIIVGTRVAPRVPVNLAYRIALSLAIFGGFTALVRGLVGMLSA